MARELTWKEQYEIGLADELIAMSSEDAVTFWGHPRQFLLETLDLYIDYLSNIRVPGVGWKIIELEILKGKAEKLSA